MNVMYLTHPSFHQWRDLEDVHFCTFCFGSYFIYRYCISCFGKFCPFPKCPMFWKNHACNKVCYTNQFSKTSSFEVHHQQHYDTHAKPYHPVTDVTYNGILETGSRAVNQKQSQHKKFPCNQCGKNFGRKSDLKTHLRVHTGKRPYTCQVCEKRFIQIGHLSAHLLTHGGEKYFTCSFCGKSFSRKDSLNKHFLIHTREKPYKCDFCGDSFSSCSNRKRHINSFHAQRSPQL